MNVFTVNKLTTDRM